MATYPDHIGLFRDELAGWLPEVLFDAHLHLGPPAAVNSIAEARRSDPLTTFSSFTHEELLDCYGQVFSGCRLAGAIAFPFPLREVNYETANRYLADVVRRDPRIHGFILSNPTDTRQTIAQFEEALSEGVRFRGVKPYYDLLGRGAVRSVYDIRIEEFVPDELLEFMNHEKLIMMLHTSRIGMGDPECQQFVRRAARQFPDVSIILAHMGRYLEDRHFFDFLDSGIAELPSVYLEMSSATSRSVYLETLRRPPLHDRLLFGADLPFGLITGQEFFSAESGPTFLTRDDYAWTDKALAQKFRLERLQMTYNTWHTVRAFKCALEELDADEAVKTSIKERVFRCNAESLLARGRGHSQPDSSSC